MHCCLRAVEVKSSCASRRTAPGCLPIMPRRGPFLVPRCRRAALENLAHAARIQALSTTAQGDDGTSPAVAEPPIASAASFLGPDAGSSCLASVGLDGDCPAEIRSHVTDEHLLQFAAVAGEAAAAAAAAELRLPAAWSGEGSLLGGTADGEAAPCTDDGWEQVGFGAVLVLSGVQASCSRGLGMPTNRFYWFQAISIQVLCADAPAQRMTRASPQPCRPPPLPPRPCQVVDRASEGLRYQVWRQELRRGLYMYRSVATFLGIAPRDLRPFHLDDHAR